MRRVCVFAGTKPGNDPGYVAETRALGRALVERQIGLVFGGSTLGLMGELAREVLSLGGEVRGVLPRQLRGEEAAFHGITALIEVNSMHARKSRMAKLADGFIALPGGFGTLDELFEMVTWAQLGLHHKPCALYNVRGYFDPLAAFLDHAAGEGFLSPAWRDTVVVEEDPGTLIQRLIERRAELRAAVRSSAR